MQHEMSTRSTLKVRRDWAGGKRGNGHERQREGRRVRRPDPRRIRLGACDDTVSAYGGLAAFGAFVRELGVDRELRARFGRLKTSEMVVYPMQAQLRLLMDTFAVGEHRPFAIEALSGDPLFVHLAGGIVPSLDTVYRDLLRFDDESIVALETLMARHGLQPLKRFRRRGAVVHLDVDTSVTPVFGHHEGALPGPNPHYHGRPSYHPILARVAETDTVVGAKLRPGNTGFGGDDVPTIEAWIDKTRAAVGPNAIVYVRVDAAGDCTELLQMIERRGCYYVVKAKLHRELCFAAYNVKKWTTVDWDADGKPNRQVADVEFVRKPWRDEGLSVRVVAVRSRERETGRQLYLWDNNDYTVEVFLTNDWHSDIVDLAHRYHGRAGIEPLIAELKGAYGIGDAPSNAFAANHAALLLKMLVHNLMRRFVAARLPALRSWRAPWLRRVLLCIPGRLTRHGRSRTLRLTPGSALYSLSQLE